MLVHNPLIFSDPIISTELFENRVILGKNPPSHLLRDDDLLLGHLLELPRQELHLELDALQLVEGRKHGPRLAHALQVHLAHEDVEL